MIRLGNYTNYRKTSADYHRDQILMNGLDQAIENDVTRFG